MREEKPLAQSHIARKWQSPGLYEAKSLHATLTGPSPPVVLWQSQRGTLPPTLASSSLICSCFVLPTASQRPLLTQRSKPPLFWPTLCFPPPLSSPALTASLFSVTRPPYILMSVPDHQDLGVPRPWATCISSVSRQVE